MRLRYTETEEAFRAELVEWLDRNAPPSEQFDAAKKSSASFTDWGREWQRTLFAAGWLLPGWPPELGGRHASVGEQMIYYEEMSRRDILRSQNPQALGIIAPSLRDYGTPAQQERWLPDLVTYDKVGAWAITEPDSGSDAFGGMKSYVVRATDGTGDYILNGQKTFITNGPDADVVVVYAKLDEPGVDKRDRRVLTFVLDRGMDGFVQSKPFRKMGINSSRTGELFFSNVRLGRDRLLGETEGDGAASDGRASARSNFSAERIGVAAMALGVIEECLRLCVDYAKNRKLWGQEIGQFQLIQLKLAQMELARMNVRNMLFRVIEAMQTGTQISLAEASAIKWYCSQAATDVAMDAVQLFGGNGYMTEYRVEQLARDAKSLMIYAGSNEVQITHVAKGLLS